MLRKFLTNLLKNSSRVHIRIEPVQTSQDLVDLIDRFVFESEMRYPLEWDDFISWKNGSAQAEQVRERLGEHERLLFSRDRKLINQYAKLVLAERNRLASLIGSPTREFPSD